MEASIIIKLRELIRNWVFWVIIITIAAIIIRSLPAWTNAAWGCDFGIYLGLTKSFVESGELYNQYYGWGNSYQYFPVLYAITGFAHWLTGIDILVLMSKIAPIFGGLTILIFYFLVYELIKDRKIAILSALFLAVLPFHVYQLSHAAPLTMGHFFMMFSMYLFVKFRQNLVYVIPLIISTILLIMSHHLTTYFYIISLIFIVFFENASIEDPSIKKWTLSIKKDVFYIVLTSVLVFSYWAFIATTVYEDFMSSGFSIASFKIESIYIIILFYILFFCSFGIAILIRRFNIFIKRAILTVKNRVLKFFVLLSLKLNPFIKKEEPTYKSRVMIFLIIMMIFLTSMTIFLFKKLPWTNFPFTLKSMILSIPLLVVFAFVAIGFRFTAYIKNGFFIRGWIIAILLSFLYGLITNSDVILPDRHFEYLMYPVAIIAVYGIGAIFFDQYHKALFSKLGDKKDLFVKHNLRKIKISQKHRLIHFIVILVLVVSLAGSVYPSFKELKASEEGITNEDLAVITWISENLDKNTSLISSDHRLARLAESEGYNTTKDETIKLWSSENLTDYIDELMGIGKNHTKITHIIIDDIMKNEVVHVGYGKIIYMTNSTWTAAYDKFSQQPFELLYRNETIQKDPITEEPIHWAEIYCVNWTYLESITYKKS